MTSFIEDGTFHEKAEALSQIFDPMSQRLLYIDGDRFVSTMSKEAVEFYAVAMVYWAKNGNFTAYESQGWGSPQPVKSYPSNAIKCAPQKGKCKCHIDSVVYFGLMGEDGRLDTSVNYAEAKADHSGWTPCRN